MGGALSLRNVEELLCVCGIGVCHETERFWRNRFVPLFAPTSAGNERRREIGRHANSCAENSHLRFRRRKRAMLRFRQMKSLQKFCRGPCLRPQSFLFRTLLR